MCAELSPSSSMLLRRARTRTLFITYAICVVKA
jgi:hypothetical protein